MLIKGSYNEEMCAKYPELNNGLQQELMFFHSQFKSKFSNLDECRILFQSLVPEVRMMFTQVEQLLRLLLQSPASSCSAERSFSALRRLKTWLCSTMGQERLSSLMTCHVHRDRLMEIDPNEILNSRLLYHKRTF